MWNYKKVKKYMLNMDMRAWERGVAIDALLAVGDEENALIQVEKAIELQNFAGELSKGDGTWVDGAANGPGILYFYNKFLKTEYYQACQKQYNFLQRAPRSLDQAILHTKEKTEVWVDTIYMIAPFLVMMGDFEGAISELDYHKKVLFDENIGLYRHGWSDTTNSYSREGFWGVGNGWAMNGLLLVIESLPLGYSERKRLIDFLINHINTVLEYQNEDGMWYYMLDDSSTWVETNCSQMFVYAILRAISHGWLDELYYNKIEKAIKNISKKVKEDGAVIDACGAPSFDFPGIGVESQAFNLILYAEMEKHRCIRSSFL